MDDQDVLCLITECETSFHCVSVYAVLGECQIELFKQELKTMGFGQLVKNDVYICVFFYCVRIESPVVGSTLDYSW